MITATRKIEIDAAHRVPDHKSKCRNLHGHRYVIEVTVTTSTGCHTEGEQNGMIVDFSFLKEFMVRLIDNMCDHGTIMYIHDPLLNTLFPDIEVNNNFVETFTALELIYGYADYTSVTGKLFLMNAVPTAENLARLWYNLLTVAFQQAVQDKDTRIPEGLEIQSVTVYETPNCKAVYTPR